MIYYKYKFIIKSEGVIMKKKLTHILLVRIIILTGFTIVINHLTPN